MAGKMKMARLETWLMLITLFVGAGGVAAGTATLALHKLSQVDARAVCTDGSPGAYYFARAAAAGGAISNSTFIIHLQEEVGVTTKFPAPSAVRWAAQRRCVRAKGMQLRVLSTAFSTRTIRRCGPHIRCSCRTARLMLTWATMRRIPPKGITFAVES